MAGLKCIIQGNQFHLKKFFQFEINKHVFYLSNRFATRKAAKDAAARASRGRGNNKVISNPPHGNVRMNNGTATEEQKKEQHNQNKKGDKSQHFHSTDAKGDKLENKMHYLHSKRTYN